MPVSHNQLKLIRSLRSKKIRNQKGLYLVEGRKMIQDLLNSNAVIEGIFYAHGEDESLYPEGTLISEEDLKSISQLTTPDRVLAVVKIPNPTFELPSLNKQLTPVLDGIRDPGNLGSMLRIADWFGFKQIICSKDTVDIYNPKTVQASMGSIFRISVHYVNLESFFEEVEIGIPVFGCVLNGSSIYETELPPQGLLVIGSESHGISERVELKLTNRISIPKFGQAESLNAAMAMAVLCSEIKRRGL